MPMTFLRAGETGMIQRVGGAEDTKRFLANLGFVDGAAVTVISELNGNLIVNIKDSRVADQQGDGKARYGAVAVKKDSDCSAVCLIPQGSADWEEWAVMDDESSSGSFPTLLFPHRLACTN